MRKPYLQNISETARYSFPPLPLPLAPCLQPLSLTPTTTTTTTSPSLLQFPQISPALADPAKQPAGRLHGPRRARRPHCHLAARRARPAGPRSNAAKARQQLHRLRGRWLWRPDFLQQRQRCRRIRPAPASAHEHQWAWRCCGVRVPKPAFVIPRLLFLPLLLLVFTPRPRGPSSTKASAPRAANASRHGATAASAGTSPSTPSPARTEGTGARAGTRSAPEAWPGLSKAVSRAGGV